MVRTAAIAAASWLLFLALVGLGAWRLSGHPMTLLMLCVMLGLPALLMPAAISIIFSHGLLGVLFCLILGLVRRRMTAAAGTLYSGSAVPPGRQEMPSTLTNIVPYGVPLAAFVLIGLGSAAWAADPADPADPAKPPPTTYSVYIPVDCAATADQRQVLSS